MTRDAGCIFCKIVAGDLPAEKVYEDDRVLAFKDIHPIAPVHVLFVPKHHVATLNDIPDDDPILLSVLAAVKKVARDLGVADSGYRVMMNVNQGGGQVIFHYHLHLIA
jgi:histidine triad (HIT) family protein